MKSLVRSLFFALFLFAAAGSPPCQADEMKPLLTASSEKHEKHNLVLIIVDTFGAAHFGADTEGRDITPNLSRLAREGVTFQNALSTAPWTRPSIGSIFTGYTPLAHGIRKITAKQRFNAATPTLAERLKELGYETAGIVSHTFLAPQTDFSRGFDSYRIVDFSKGVHEAVTSSQVSQMAIDWLHHYTSEKRSKPFFLFIHYFDPHFNYIGHPEFDRTSWYKGSLSSGMLFSHFRRLAPQLSSADMKFMVGLYREEIGYTDQQVGRVLDVVREVAKRENTSVIAMADHGEEFKEHNRVGHGHTMFNELLHVPMLLWNPRLFKPMNITSWVSTCDAFPTLVPFQAPVVPDGFRGRSLLPLIESAERERTPDRYLFAEANHRVSMVAVMQEPFKFVFDRRSKRKYLFDLKKDPLEQTNLAKQDGATASRFMTTMEGYLKAHEEIVNSRAGEKAEPLLPKEVEALKTLGYL